MYGGSTEKCLKKKSCLSGWVLIGVLEGGEFISGHPDRQLSLVFPVFVWAHDRYVLPAALCILNISTRLIKFFEAAYDVPTLYYLPEVFYSYFQQIFPLQKQKNEPNQPRKYVLGSRCGLKQLKNCFSFRRPTSFISVALAFALIFRDQWARGLERVSVARGDDVSQFECLLHVLE